MAVGPRKLGLTRDQFASFLQDFEQIKQFENLFAAVDTIANVELNDINIAAGNANATANEANDSIQRLLDSLDREPVPANVSQLAVIETQLAALNMAPPASIATVTSVSGTGTVNGLTLTGTVTTSGSLTLGGTLSGVSLTTQVSGTLPVTNGGTGVTTSTGTGSVVLSAGPTFTGTLNAATISATKILPNVQSIASASTITPNADTDTQVSVTALAVPATIAAPSGTPSDGQSLVIRIEDNGTGRALTWTTGSSGAYRAVGITLPTTTVATKVLYVGCKYNSTDLRWDAIALSQEA